ncbi:MAG: hypothetical protein IKP40_02360 [Clostridia bacterium]|nr:hypothetical protein [Clostridia bacterium]
MKRTLALIAALCLCLWGLAALAEEELLDTLLEGIEDFEGTELETPPDEPLLLSGDSESVTLDVSLLQRYGITYQDLMSTQRTTYLPAAALSIATGEHFGFVPEESKLVIYIMKEDSSLDLFEAILNYDTDAVYLLHWNPGSTTAVCQKGRGIERFYNLNAQALPYLTQLDAATLPAYYQELRGGGYQALQVGRAAYRLSEDRQHIYISRPSVTGGSGQHTIAYNIYDSGSNPINYFYSTEETVAASPGCGGLFNVFIVVSDIVTGESLTQNIGWQQISWPRANALTVSPLVFEVSANGESVYVNRPDVACVSGEATIAYNLYDSHGNPVNYFYSISPRVAVTPDYGGLFNVFVVVTDTVTGEQSVQDVGWQTLTRETLPQGVCRALLIGQTSVPGCQSSLSYLTDIQNIDAMLKNINGGAYAGHTTMYRDLSRALVLANIASAYSGAAAGDVSFFYIGTHGVKDRLTGNTADQEGALGCADGKSLKLKDLATALSKANPNNEVIVLLSACGSGAAIKDGSGSAALTARDIISAFAACDPGLTVKSADKRQELRKNKFYVLTAADVYESSWYFPDDSAAGSFMGVSLCQATSLEGGYCKADANHDRQITFEELYAFMYDYCYRASGYADARQHMQRWPENSDWVVFRY